MRKKFFGVLALSCAFAGAAYGGDIFLDFEDPDIVDLDAAPNPYNGITVNTTVGDGLSKLGLMDYSWYNATYGASLASISGEQVGWSRFGEDNMTMDLPASMFANSVYLTPWIGFGPPRVTVTGFLGGNEVLNVDAAMVTDQWTFVDLGGVEVDTLNFSNNGGGTWYLMEDLSLKVVPAPAGLAMFGLLAFSRRRRR